MPSEEEDLTEQSQGDKPWQKLTNKVNFLAGQRLLRATFWGARSAVKGKCEFTNLATMDVSIFWLDWNFCLISRGSNHSWPKLQQFLKLVMLKWTCGKECCHTGERTPWFSVSMWSKKTTCSNVSMWRKKTTRFGISTSNKTTCFQHLDREQEDHMLGLLQVTQEKYSALVDVHNQIWPALTVYRPNS